MYSAAVSRLLASLIAKLAVLGGSVVASCTCTGSQAMSLQRLVETQVMERFTATGLTSHLAPAELKRRAQEAASVMVRLLAESRLLEAHGDMTSPEAYSLPDGVLRRILKPVPPLPQRPQGDAT